MYILLKKNIKYLYVIKKAMKLAQKQAFAKHRSNITSTKFGFKKNKFY